jgi:hypothetical protein
VQAYLLMAFLQGAASGSHTVHRAKWCMLSILLHIKPRLVLRNVCSVTCIMAHTACVHSRWCYAPAWTCE